MYQPYTGPQQTNSNPVDIYVHNASNQDIAACSMCRNYPITCNTKHTIPAGEKDDSFTACDAEQPHTLNIYSMDNLDSPVCEAELNAFKNTANPKHCATGYKLTPYKDADGTYEFLFESLLPPASPPTSPLTSPTSSPPASPAQKSPLLPLTSPIYSSEKYDMGLIVAIAIIISVIFIIIGGIAIYMILRK